jgi:hypothetical protein
MLLADAIADTVVPKRLAIADNVSPGFTTYVCDAEAVEDLVAAA